MAVSKGKMTRYGCFLTLIVRGPSSLESKTREGYCSLFNALNEGNSVQRMHKFIFVLNYFYFSSHYPDQSMNVIRNPAKVEDNQAKQKAYDLVGFKVEARALILLMLLSLLIVVERAAV